MRRCCRWFRPTVNGQGRRKRHTARAALPTPGNVMTNLYSSDYPAIGSQAVRYSPASPIRWQTPATWSDSCLMRLKGSIGWVFMCCVKTRLSLGRSRATPPAFGLLSAAECVELPSPNGERSELPMCIRSPDTFVCDPESRSEIVVPLISGDRVLGVLDIDSPHPDRFTDADQRGLEMLCRNL